MARDIEASFTPDEARRLLNELSYMAKTQHVTEDVHALIRRLRSGISDAGNGPTTVNLADDNVDPRER